MPDPSGNYIDIIVVIVLLYHVLQGVRVGVWPLITRLISFFVALVLGFSLYASVGHLIAQSWNILPLYANGIGFIVVFLLAQMIVGFLVGSVVNLIPESFRYNWFSKVLAIIPACIDGIILVGLVLFLSLTLPISPSVKTDITDSFTGKLLTEHVQEVGKEISARFITDAGDLGVMTVHPESDERIEIPYRPTRLTVEPETEEQMLVLVNEERAKVGAPPLVMDAELTEVARAQSRDMWERQYFAHVNPDGETPFDRIDKAGIPYNTAGENLALAPTLQLAHTGLMNSPGHRRNILDPNFRRVGIGVIDGGIYGKMFTQDFTD